jgi:hypothetical protein
MSERLTIREFAAHLHARFQVAQVDGCELELTEINDCSNAQLEQFSFIFTGTASPSLPQGLYNLVRPRIGEYELLVPIGPDAVGMRYEAAFSRFLHAPGVEPVPA